MKATITILVSLLICASSASAGRVDDYDWNRSSAIEVDLNRNGQIDFVRLGIADESVGLLVTVDSMALPVIDIPIDGSRQFGICPGSDPSISLMAQSEAPLDALGAMPEGYEACSDCIEIVVVGGECDALHFYWNTVTEQLSWWRA